MHIITTIIFVFKFRIVVKLRTNHISVAYSNMKIEVVICMEGYH